MERRQIERITSPAIALAAIASAVLVAVNPDRALLWIAPAPAIAAIGCLLGAQLSVRMRAPAAVVVFLAEAAFWLTASGYLVSQFVSQS